MTRKRKACEALDEPWGKVEEVDHEPPVETLLQEEACIPLMPASQAHDSQTIESAPGASEDILQQPEEGALTMAYTCDLGSGVVANEDDGSVSQNRNLNATKRLRISEEARLKKIIITCEWSTCALEFNKMERFVSHITDHLLAIAEPVSNEGYLCYWRECDFACTTKEEMDRHVYFHAFHAKIKSVGALLLQEVNEKCILDSSGRNVVPEIPEVFQCMWEDCTTKFASAHDFYCHTLSHVRNTDTENSNKKAFVCAWDGCSSSFAKQARLRDHVRSHTQEKLVGCPNCGGIFASNTKFFDHCFRQIPLESQKYQCSHCSRRYANERLLRDHVRHHINHYKCPECDMTVPNKSTLVAHMRYRHRKDKPHKCLQCGKGFTLLSDVTRHLSVHSAEPAYSCLFQNCTYKSRSVTALNKHIRLVHNGLDKHHYACHVCDFRFTLGDSLTKHLIKTHSFAWPVGHTRFRYKQDEDGFYRLQTVRYESIELNQETVNEGEEDEETVDSPEASTYPSSPASLSTQSSQLTPMEPTMQHNEEGDNQDPQQLLCQKETESRVTEYQEIIMPSQF